VLTSAAAKAFIMKANVSAMAAIGCYHHCLYILQLYRIYLGVKAAWRTIAVAVSLKLVRRKSHTIGNERKPYLLYEEKY
jgi:hypothetical protein